MTRFEWYASAFANLGFFNTVKLQLSKRASTPRKLASADSKYLRHPVFYRPDSSDLYVFDQVFRQREYSCFDDLADTGLILDLGANVGYSSAYFLSQFPNCFVIAVEPDAGNFAILNKNLEPYKGRYHAVNAAVWSKNTTLHFEPETMGAHTEWGRRVTADNTGGSAVDAVDVETLTAMAQHSRISILKVDIEGAEREIFARNYSSWLGRTDNFCIEIHDEGCRKVIFDAISDRNFFLSTSGELLVGRGATEEDLRL